MQSSGARKGIVDKSYYKSFGAGGWGLWINPDGRLIFQTANSCTNTGPATVTPGQWTFVTGILHYYSSTSQAVDFYINGVLDQTVNGSLFINGATTGYADLLVGNLENNLIDTRTIE